METAIETTKQTTKDQTQRSRLFTIFNANGSDTAVLSQMVAEQLAKAGKTIVVELPCLGVPKLAFLYDRESIERKQSIDQLLIDYERKDMRSVYDYVLKGENVDLLLIHPQISPLSPTLTRLTQLNTLLDLPALLRSVLDERYANIVFSLQGQLMHPMTMFSLRIAERIIMNMHRAEELPWTMLYYNRLVDEMTIDPSKISLYSNERNIAVKQLELSYSVSDLMKKLQKKGG